MDAVTFRFFAGASRAMGRRELSLGLDHPSTLAELVDRLGVEGDQARVLGLCTWLVDSHQAGPGTPVAPGATIDALPPFAGG